MVFKAKLADFLQKPLRLPPPCLHSMWSSSPMSLGSNSCHWLILDEILEQFKVQSGPWPTYPKEIGLAKP